MSKKEIFDVVDENDNVIGQATREECHADQTLIHRAVHFTLIDKGSQTILLTKRSLIKETDPGKLTFLGEHMTTGETYEEAIVRGVSEEVGYTPKQNKEIMKHMFRYHGQTEIVAFFVVEWNKEALQFAKDEITEYEWLTVSELVSGKYKCAGMTREWIEMIDWDCVSTDWLKRKSS